MLLTSTRADLLSTTWNQSRNVILISWSTPSELRFTFFKMIQDLSNSEYFDHSCISDYRASLTFSLTSFCWLWWHFEMNSGIATLTSKSNQSNQYEMNMAKVAAAVGRTSFPIHFYSNFWEGNDVWDQATSDRTFECLSTFCSNQYTLILFVIIRKS